jgi:hypothetical protein
MKTLLLLFIMIPVQLLASADYNCQVRSYNLHIDMTNDRSTHVWVINRWNYNTVYQGYVGFIERKANNTTFYFYGNYEPIKLTFKNEDLQNEPQTMRGRIDTMLEGFIVYDNFDCKKR